MKAFINNTTALVLFLLPLSHIFAADTTYKVNQIPEDLLINAKAVIRNSHIEFEIKSRSRAIKTVKYAITILNKNGIRNSILEKYYDKFSRISNLKAVVYDEEGEKIKRVPNEDIHDFSAISGFSVYEDSRVKLIDPKYLEYPFTVEYSYTITYNGIINYPDWIPVMDYGISIEKSTFSVLAPSDIVFQYLENEHAPKANNTLLEDNNKLFEWSLENYPAIRKEYYSKPIQSLTPVVYIAPTIFKISSQVGYNTSWKDFGSFVEQLNQGKINLNEVTKQKIRGITSKVSDTLDKIREIYSYLQNNTRYASIQAGLGGWEPFDAETVDKTKYGDCKALSMYMLALLDAANIKGYYTLVKAGKNKEEIIEQLPSSQFNHVIVCIPSKNDTLWLECTNQNIPFGYLGTFTDDRYALLIADTGGIMTRTKSYSKDDNQQIRTVKIRLDNWGDANADINTAYKGSFYDDYLPILRDDYKGKEQKIYKKLYSTGLNINSFSHEEVKNSIPFVLEKLDVSFSDYGVIMGNRYLVRLNPVNAAKNIPSLRTERTSDIYIRRPFTEIDTVFFEIPSDYRIYKTPDDVSIVNEFGSYYSKVDVNGLNLIYTRRLEINAGEFPKDVYDAFVDFYEQIVKADNSKAVLIKK